MNLIRALKIFEVDELVELDLESLKKKYISLAKKKHPDKKGGNSKQFSILKDAYHLLKEALREVIVQNYKSQKFQGHLTKEEILNNYYRDTNALQFRLTMFHDETKHTLSDTKNRFESIWTEFQDAREELRVEMEESVNLLHSQKNSFLSKVLFFVPGLNANSYQRRYKATIDNFNKKYNELDIEYLRKAMEVYGGGLNRINEVLTYDGEINDEEIEDETKDEEAKVVEEVVPEEDGEAEVIIANDSELDGNKTLKAQSVKVNQG